MPRRGEGGWALLVAVIVAALGCGGTSGGRPHGMPETVCMTPDGRCPPRPRGPARTAGPIERAVRGRPPAEEAAICQRAHDAIMAHAEQVDRACRHDDDCALLDVGECGTPARRTAPASELYAEWRDWLRACDSGGIYDCASYATVCVSGRCAYAPSERG